MSGRIAATALRVLSLFAVLLVLKAALFALCLVDGLAYELLSFWTLVVWAYQDAAVALAYGLLELLFLLGTPAGARGYANKALWGLWGLLLLYAAVNLPITRVFSTPLTYPMLRATGGALADSIWHYATPLHAMAMLLVLTSAAAFLRWWLSFASQTSKKVLASGLISFGLLSLLLGPWGLPRLDTLGLYRSAPAALWLSFWAQMQGTEEPKEAQGQGQGQGTEDAKEPKGPSSRPSDLPSEGKALDLRGLSGRAKGRHVLWIVLESTGARYLRPYGAKDDPMPFLTRLVQKDALIFDAGYTAYPESIKGLSSALCSRPTAARTSASHYAASRLPCLSIAHAFKNAGYQTAMLHSGWFAYLGMESVVQERGFDLLRDAGGIESPYRSSFGVDEEASVRSLHAWLAAQTPKGPTFSMYLPIAGHHPYSSPGKPTTRPFREKNELAFYKNDLCRGDLALQKLFSFLRKTGLFEKSVIVIAGDHGEAFFQHKGNFAHSLFVYEENVHVPFFVILPGLLGASKRVPQIASLIDVAPTLADLLGLPPSPLWQGRSLLPPVPGVARFLADHTLFQIGLRHGPWKFFHEVDAGRSRLFHLPSDPDEKRDRSAHFAERTTLYRRSLLDWATRQRRDVLAPKRP